jgi:predicted lipoprotein with Yx(FWY)xxD motif
MVMKSFALSMSLAVGFLGIASAQSVGSSNGMLTDAGGRVLYTFDKDEAGKSNCNGQCAGNWPPFAAAGESKTAGYSVLTRDDGTKQWALNGKPLYYFVGDAKPGDANGEGKNGVWHTVKAAK